MGIEILKYRNVPLDAPSTSGSDLVDINQLGRDIIALNLKISFDTDGDFADAGSDPLENVFSEITVEADGTPIVSLDNPAWMRLAHYLAKQYIGDKGSMPSEDLNLTNGVYELDLLIPIMVKKGQFDKLQVRIDYGTFATLMDGTISTSVTARGIYGFVEKNWYIKTRNQSLSASSAIQDVIHPTLSVPLELWAFVIDDGVAAEFFSDTTNATVFRYIRYDTGTTELVTNLTYEHVGEVFLDRIDGDDCRALTEMFLGVRFQNDETLEYIFTVTEAAPPTIDSGWQPVALNQHGFFVLKGGADVDGGDGEVIRMAQNYMHVFSGYGIRPNDETNIEYELNGANRAATDTLRWFFLSSEYPAGVSKRTVEKKKV